MLLLSGVRIRLKAAAEHRKSSLSYQQHPDVKQQQLTQTLSAVKSEENVPAGCEFEFSEASEEQIMEKLRSTDRS